jgi:hypothetical protein
VGGLGIILQVLLNFPQLMDKIIEDEADREEEFLSYLRKIEFQAKLLAENEDYNLNSQETRHLVEGKSKELMTAVVQFFNSALNYFSKGSGGILSA